MLSNLLNLAVTGPLRSQCGARRCVLSAAKRPSSLITEENSARRAFSSAVLEGGGVEGGEAEGGEDEGGEVEGGELADGGGGVLFPQSFGCDIHQQLCCRKSTPIIWKSTAASRKFQEKRRLPKQW